MDFPKSQPVRVSTVVQNLRTSQEISPEARDAIMAGLRLDRYTPHPGCPCERCARVYGLIP